MDAYRRDPNGLRMIYHTWLHRKCGPSIYVLANQLVDEIEGVYTGSSTLEAFEPSLGIDASDIDVFCLGTSSILNKFTTFITKISSYRSFTRLHFSYDYADPLKARHTKFVNTNTEFANMVNDGSDTVPYKKLKDHLVTTMISAVRQTPVKATAGTGTDGVVDLTGNIAVGDTKDELTEDEKEDDEDEEEEEEEEEEEDEDEESKNNDASTNVPENGSFISCRLVLSKRPDICTCCRKKLDSDSRPPMQCEEGEHINVDIVFIVPEYIHVANDSRYNKSSLQLTTLFVQKMFDIMACRVTVANSAASIGVQCASPDHIATRRTFHHLYPDEKESRAITRCRKYCSRGFDVARSIDVTYEKWLQHHQRYINHVFLQDTVHDNNDVGVVDVVVARNIQIQVSKFVADELWPEIQMIGCELTLKRIIIALFENFTSSELTTCDMRSMYDIAVIMRGAMAWKNRGEIHIPDLLDQFSREEDGNDEDADKKISLFSSKRDPHDDIQSDMNYLPNARDYYMNTPISEVSQSIKRARMSIQADPTTDFINSTSILALERAPIRCVLQHYNGTYTETYNPITNRLPRITAFADDRGRWCDTRRLIWANGIGPYLTQYDLVGVVFCVCRSWRMLRHAPMNFGVVSSSTSHHLIENERSKHLKKLVIGGHMTSLTLQTDERVTDSHDFADKRCYSLLTTLTDDGNTYNFFARFQHLDIERSTVSAADYLPDRTYELLSLVRFQIQLKSWVIRNRNHSDNRRRLMISQAMSLTHLTLESGDNQHVNVDAFENLFTPTIDDYDYEVKNKYSKCEKARYETMFALKSQPFLMLPKLQSIAIGMIHRSADPQRLLSRITLSTPNLRRLYLINATCQHLLLLPKLNLRFLETLVIDLHCDLPNGTLPQALAYLRAFRTSMTAVWRSLQSLSSSSSSSSSSSNTNSNNVTDNTTTTTKSTMTRPASTASSLDDTHSADYVVDNDDNLRLPALRRIEIQVAGFCHAFSTISIFEEIIGTFCASLFENNHRSTHKNKQTITLQLSQQPSVSCYCSCSGLPGWKWSTKSQECSFSS